MSDTEGSSRGSDDSDEEVEEEEVEEEVEEEETEEEEIEEEEEEEEDIDDDDDDENDDDDDDEGDTEDESDESEEEYLTDLTEEDSDGLSISSSDSEDEFKGRMEISIIPVSPKIKVQKSHQGNITKEKKATSQLTTPRIIPNPGTVTKADSATPPIAGSRVSLPDSGNLSRNLPATQDFAPSGQPKAPIKLARPGSLLQPSLKDRLAPANSTLHDVPASPSDQDKHTVEEIRNTAQHVVLCDLCSANVIEKFCKTCRVSLCNHCAEEHRSSSSKSHKVVSYMERYNATKYPECRKHSHNDCQSYCEDCDRPLCPACVSMGKHKGHKIAGDLGKGKRKKIKSDLKELEDEIYPLYKRAALDLQCEKATVEKHYDGLVTALSKYRKNWLEKIDAVIQYEKKLFIEKKSKHISSLDKQGKSVAKQMSKLVHHIQDMKKVLDTKNDFVAAEYRSRISKFKRPPLSKTIPLLRFVPHKIDENDLRQKFGFHTFSNVMQDEDGYIMTTPLLHEPEIINTVSTGCDKRLYGVDCFGDSKIWTTWGKIMNLYHINGKLLQSIQTKTENEVKNIATTKKGYLVYSDPRSKTIYRMKKKNIRKIIKLTGWTPCSVCSTSLDGLLVAMISNEKKQSKVVHYSDNLKEYLTVQFDGNGMPLYSTSSRKHISENRNLDICVADTGSCAVVVVNRTGGLRFKYTGPPPSINTSFKPGVIATDNYGQILTADSHNERIHILDQDGKFLRYIVVQKSDCPFSLSVDIKNSLFLAGEKSGNIMIISYT